MSGPVVIGELLGQPVALPLDAYRDAVRRARALLKDDAPALAPTTKEKPRPAPGNAERLYTPDEAAEMTGTSRSWWIRQARRGKVPCIKVGRAVRFSRAHIADALGKPDYLDPGIHNADITRKSLENKARASARNKSVTAIVVPRSAPDAGHDPVEGTR